MEQGRVVQAGSAEESLLTGPATEFVAHFIGRTNLLNAHVTARGDLELEGLTLALPTGRPRRLDRTPRGPPPR